MNTRVPSCSVSILTARCDIKFMQQTIPHLIRMCRYPFVERILHVDDPTLRGEYLTRPDIASAEEHYSICQRLLAAGIVDRVERIRYDRDTLVQTGKKHFGRVAPFTHDVHGYPIHGSAFCIDDVNTDYMVHFDCDMLLHSDPEFSWIAKGIELMEKHEDILFASPLAGPPSKHGTLKQDPDAKFRIDEAAGCYRFQTFTSRKFLVNRKRLSAHLPVPLVFTSVRQRLKSLFTRKSCLWNWEVMISKHLEVKALYRGDLTDPRAWTLHTPDHGVQFIAHLPEIIRKVEAGWFPECQAGDYDLRLEHWIESSR